MSIIAGIGWHVIGAGMAASFYAPIEKVKKWSWETTWAVAGIFSWILLPISVSLILLPDFRGFYAVDGAAPAVESGAIRRHVGRRQCELRPDDAASRHVAGHWRGHRRDADCGHAGAAVDARAGRDAVQHAGWPADDGGDPGGADWGGHRFLCRTSERSAAAGRDSGIQFDAGAVAGGDVRDFLIGHVVCD